ncbi:uncharacterized protein [Macaca nemestrina]|uniref:uncharacterized protein n=1 Tax=Macaca nemestrina TaxID=9545 RepID=UPI0039B9210A
MNVYSSFIVAKFGSNQDVPQWMNGLTVVQRGAQKCECIQALSDDFEDHIERDMTLSGLIWIRIMCIGVRIAVLADGLIIASNANKLKVKSVNKFPRVAPADLITFFRTLILLFTSRWGHCDLPVIPLPQDFCTSNVFYLECSASRSCTDAGPAVLHRVVGDGELAQVVAHHLWLDLHLVEGLTVVDAHHAAHHLGQYDHVLQVRLHHFRLLHGRYRLLGLAQAPQRRVLLPPEAPVGPLLLECTVQLHKLLVGQVQQLVQVHNAKKGYVRSQQEDVSLQTIKRAVTMDQITRHLDHGCLASRSAKKRFTTVTQGKSNRSKTFSTWTWGTSKLIQCSCLGVLLERRLKSRINENRARQLTACLCVHLLLCPLSFTT